MIRNFEMDKNTRNTLITIQQELMSISTQLADDRAFEVSKKNHTLKPMDKNNVIFLENQIDLISKELPELKNFVISGGHSIISYTHVAKCSCRRVERLISEHKDKKRVPNMIIAYINRLSDYLFTLARKFTYDMGMSEIKWISKKNRSPLLSNSLKNLFLHKFLYLCIGH
tara:strand:+ start:1097 stop:1606 length:510 start_codon:yes stop_codon:yes gene_type:complete